MFTNTHAFSGFSVDDLANAKVFYSQTLGLDVEETGMGLLLHLATGARIFIYPKADHTPATYTILNFPVDDIDSAVDALARGGVAFARYERDDLPQDEKGIARGLARDGSPDIAWFTDPAGNVLSILQEKA